jgi:hypothetical protein
LFYCHNILNMDDIIVLILTLIFIIAGVFGQMKKRQTAANSEPDLDSSSEKTGNGNFWEHLKDEWDEPEQENIQPAYQKQPKYQNIRQDYLFKAEDEGKRSIPIITTKFEPLQVDKRASKGIKFSLKKAVIYSEILHRKYE